jgi:hypothetical protein
LENFHNRNPAAAEPTRNTTTAAANPKPRKLKSKLLRRLRFGGGVWAGLSEARMNL